MSTFSIIGCQHAHIGIFIKEMLKLGHTCAGIYEKENIALSKAMSEQFNVPLVDDREILLSDEVDFVGSAAINNEKIDIVELCEKYGKHVMLDKPAVTHRDGLNRLKAVAERGTIQFGLLLTERFRPSLYTLKNIIAKGEIGKVINIAMRKPHRLSPHKRPSWHFSKEQCGGIIVDLFIHDVDLLRWLTNSEIASVQGMMSKNILPEHPEFYDVATLQLSMDQGTCAQLYADWHNPESSWTWGDCRIFVTGTEGVVELRIEGDPLISKDELVLKVTHQHELTNVVVEAAPVSITEDFINRIEGKDAWIQHKDIIAAIEATIDADETATIINTLKKL
jgi:predicted dehydrogenase